MVANRKKPVQPVTSRTNTTQAVPRVVKGKAPQLTGDDALVTQNGVSAGKDTRSSSSPKSKTKRKTPTPMPRRKSLLDRLFLPSLITFFIYALLVCRSGTAHTHTVCRSLFQYHHRILEPYVFPPIRAAITHPIIQEPYKTHVEPVLEKIIIASEPAVRAVKFADHKARPVLVASYNKGKAVYVGTVVPWWSRAVVPRYHLHVAPHVEKRLGPVLSATEQYIARLHPHIRAVQIRVHRFQASLEPYVLKTYHTLLEVYHKAQPHVQKGYETVRPHAIRLWAQAKPFLCRAWGVIKVQSRIALKTLAIQMRHLAVELGNARRQYVDPHILRIWEKVSESGSSSSSFDSGKEEGDIIRLDDIPETDESTVAPTPTPAVSPSPSPIPSSSEVIESVEVTPSPAETANDEVVTPAATPVDTEQEEKEKAVSVAEESAGHASSVVAEIEREVSGVTPTPAPEPEHEPEVTSSTIIEPEPTPEVNKEEASAASIVAASAGGESVLVHGEVLPTAAVTEEEAEEIDDFLRDLGLDNASDSDASASDAQVVQQQQAPPKELTPEEKEAETAAKRADIVGRHVRWQAELASLAKEKERTVKKAIEEVRVAAVQELKEMSNGLRDNSGKLRSSKDSSKARGVVDGVQFEGEKLLKGADAYLSKAEKRSESWKRVPGEQQDKEVKEKKRADEEGKWTKVLEKVQEKFKEIVRSVQGEVHAWYLEVREREIAQVLDAAHEVKMLAERAQADIGLDYAWLDDVTYTDWQKYHDLMRTSEAFEQTARSLQNSTHPAHPADPVLGALNGLEREMQDVVAGFNVRIAELGSLGRSVFSPFVDGEEEDTTYSVTDVPKDEVEDLDGGVLLGGKEVVGSLDVSTEEEEEQVVLGLGAAPVVPQIAEEPEVSILPVADEEVSENEDVVDTSKIILGKSKEQVEGALGGVSREEL